ncbi:MAG: IS110 family transposase [Microbacterium sp.]
MNEIESVRSGHVVIGVDTHKHIHVAAVMDSIGGILANLTIATDAAGFTQLLEWASSFGKIIAFGVEGTGSYGAGLTSFVRRHGHKVIEVSRPDRRLRRLNGKSDTLDAENAARAVLAGFATAIPKTADGAVEMIRQLKVAHDTAVKDRSAAMITLKAMLVHAPEQLRADTAHRTQRMIARHCAALRPRTLETPDDSIHHTLRSIAKRWIALDEEVKELVTMIEQLVIKRAPHLLDEFGIGVNTATEILIVAGDNPERIKSEAAFAKLAGISPVPTGSGMTSGKHRINHGGHRQLNTAIYRTVIVRMQHHEPTKAYVARRTAEGKSKRDIIRCLKRYVIREVYQLIKVNPRTGEITS